MADLRVLFFGDSFVAGAGDPEGRGWVGRLAREAASAGVPITPYNLGVRHETSVDVAARWRAEARPRMRPQAEYRLVLSVGANDVAPGERSPTRVTRGESLDAFGAILREAGGTGIPAMAVGPPPAGDREMRDRLRDLSKAFAAESEVCGVPFVSVLEPLASSATWAAETDPSKSDGVHPAAGGYDELSELVLAAGWLDWLRRPNP